MHSRLVLRLATKEDASHPSSLPLQMPVGGLDATASWFVLEYSMAVASEKGECLLSCNLVTRSLGRPHFYASALALIAVL